MGSFNNYSGDNLLSGSILIQLISNFIIFGCKFEGISGV
jgi:hypothetical protein